MSIIAAALYRVSTNKQLKNKTKKKDKKESIEDSIPLQQHLVRNYAAKNGFELPAELEYIEPGVSAYKISSADRDILQDVLADAAAGKFTKLLIFKHDRLSRKSFEYPMILKQFYDYGVDVIDITSGKVLNITDQMDKLIRYIEGWQSETESKNTSIRVTAAMMDMAREGMWSGGRPPYGFQLCEFKKAVFPLVIDEKEAAVLRIMENCYIEKGWGSKKTASFLNDSGYRTREKKLWTDARVRRVLQNPIIAGLPAYNRTRSGNVPGSRTLIKNWYDLDNPEIIIPRDEAGNPKPIEDYVIIPLPRWLKVTKLMKSRAQNTVPDSRSTESTALLTGFLKCGYCGKGFISSKTKKKKKFKNGNVYVYTAKSYRCFTKARVGTSFCLGQGSYSQQKIDNIFMSELEKFLGNLDLGNLEEYITIKQASRSSIIRSQIKQLQKQRKKTQNRLNSWVDRLNVYFSDPENSVYSEELLSEQVKQAELEISDIKTNIANLQSELDQSTLEHDNLVAFSKMAPRWFEIFEAAEVPKKKEMLKQIVEQIDLWKDRMEITYNINLIELAAETESLLEQVPGLERQVNLKIAVDI